MNIQTIPPLNTQEEFHNWCLNKAPITKLDALVQNWDALIGGACLLKPTEASFSGDKGEGIITFDIFSDEQRTAVRGLQALFQKSISNSNLSNLPQSEGEGRIVIGKEHGYLTALLGVASQNRHMAV